MISPTDVRRYLMEVVKARHREHLERYCLERSLKPIGTPNYDVLSEPGGRKKSQKAPIVLMGVNGFGELTRDEDDNFSLTWRVTFEIHVEGRSREDVINRRDVYFMTLLECLVQRVPVDELIDEIEIDPDWDADDGKPTGSTSLLGVVVFDVFVRTPNALQQHGLPPHNSEIPPGTPGGAALPGQLPASWPSVDAITDETDREDPRV